MRYIGKPIESKGAVFGCDIETSAIKPFGEVLISIALSDGEDTWIFFPDLHDLTAVRALLEDSDIVKVFHTAKFDLQWLLFHYSIEATNVHDVYLVEHLLTAGKELKRSLAHMLERYVGIPMSKEVRKEFENHPGAAQRPITKAQQIYMEEDVLHLPAIYYKQRQAIEMQELEQPYALEHHVLPAVIEMELGGMNFDDKLWIAQLIQMQALMDKSTAKMRELIGSSYVLSVPRKKQGKDIVVGIAADEINFNSTQQLTALLQKHPAFNATITSTKAEVLDTLSKGTGLLATFATNLLAYRKWKKRAGYDYPKYVNPATEKVHTEFNQTGARTARFSSSNPNVQNIPRPGDKSEPNMRHLWIPDTPEYRILRADYSQQEVRVLADISCDTNLIRACEAEDVYLEIAKILFDDPTLTKDSHQRFLAKQFVLAVAYGAKPPTLATSTGLSVAKCAEVRNLIIRTFPVMHAWSEQMERQAAQYGYVNTVTGRKRYFVGTRYWGNAAINTPVQGTAAEMMKLALGNMYQHLTNFRQTGKIDVNTRLWLTVHDEMNLHVHMDNVTLLTPILQDTMEDAGKTLCPTVKHIAEVEVLTRWDK